MKICAFTEDELYMFRQRCNFTDLEMDCFNLKAKNKTNYQISMELNICDSTQARAGFQAKGMGGTDANKKGFRDSGKGIGAISTDLSDLQQAGGLVHNSRPSKKSRVIL